MKKLALALAMVFVSLVALVLAGCARAKQLLAEANYPADLEVKLHAVTLGPTPLVVQALAGYLNAIGVKVKILPEDVGAYAVRRLPSNRWATAKPLEYGFCSIGFCQILARL